MQENMADVVQLCLSIIRARGIVITVHFQFLGYGSYKYECDLNNMMRLCNRCTVMIPFNDFFQSYDILDN